MALSLQDQESTALPLMEKQLQEANAAIDNMLNAIQQGILTKSTKQRLEDLENARDDLENRIALEKIAKPRITEEQIRSFLQRFQRLDVTKLDHRKMLIDVFINSIRIYNDHMDIIFNYKDGTKTVNFSQMGSAPCQRASGSDLEFSGVPHAQMLEPADRPVSGTGTPRACEYESRSVHPTRS